MFIAFFIVFCVVVGIIANSRGRNGLGWFLLSLLATPILMLVLLLCLPRVGHQAQVPETAPEMQAITEKVPPGEEGDDLVTDTMLFWAIVGSVLVVVVTVIVGKAVVG